MDQIISIDSDDVEIANLLRELARRVTDAGGYLHPRLAIVVKRGQLTVESDAPTAERLVRLPESCLLPIDGVEFEIKDDRINITSYPDGMGADKRAMLECMLAIYNRGNKVHDYRRELPWLAFAGAPELLELLHRARVDAPKPTQLYELAKLGASDQLALEGFLGSRTLNFRLGSGLAQKVIMPFIDFFNHHATSPSFSREDDALNVTASRPVDGSNECFVQYNLLDGMDAFLIYGFFDASAQFMRSVPLQIGLPGVGTIQIRARVALLRKQSLPPGLTDLGFFLPRCQRESGSVLATAQLLVPPPGSLALLHRVLAVLIQTLKPGIAQQDLRAAVDSAVQQTLAANEAYYRDLETLIGAMQKPLERTPALDQLRALIRSQQEKLVACQEAISDARIQAYAGVAFPYDFGQSLIWS